MLFLHLHSMNSSQRQTARSFFQALLLLLFLVPFAAPAKAQTVALYCAGQNPSQSFYVNVDYQNAQVTERHELSGMSFGPTAARISDQAISWIRSDYAFRIDRITGEKTNCSTKGEECFPPTVCRPVAAAKPKF